MNQPTREEFDELKRRFEQLERETEPMRLERRLSIPESNTLQQTFEGVARANTEIGTLKGDVSALKQSVARLEQKLDDGFQAVEKRLDAIAEVQKLILARLPEEGGE